MGGDTIPPMIGVLLPVRNAVDTIETCLGTLRDQDYPHIWTYLVDDSSDDGTYEFLRIREGWYSRLVRNETRRGWPATLNRAAEMAIEDGCDLLFVANADDFYRLDCIRRCEQELRWGSLDFVVPLVQQIGGENVVQESMQNATLTDFRDHTPIVAFCLITAAAWLAVGGYHTDVSLPPDSAGDPMAGHNEMDFYIRLLKAGYRYRVLTHLRPLVYYRMHQRQLHRAVERRHDEALQLIHRKHPEVLGERGSQ